MPQPVLDVIAATSLGIVRFDTAESPPHINGTLRLPLIELFAVEIVHLRSAAPKEEQHRGDLAPTGQQRGAFLDKSTERGKPRAGGHADDRRLVQLRLVWQMKRGVRRANRDIQFVAANKGGEVGSGDADVLFRWIR